MFHATYHLLADSRLAPKTRKCLKTPKIMKTEKEENSRVIPGQIERYTLGPEVYTTPGNGLQTDKYSDKQPSWPI